MKIKRSIPLNNVTVKSQAYRFRCTSSVTKKRQTYVLSCKDPGRVIALLAMHGWIVHIYYAV